MVVVEGRVVVVVVEGCKLVVEANSDVHLEGRDVTLFNVREESEERIEEAILGQMTTRV